MGRLGKDPETKTLASGTTVTNFSVATGKKWKDKEGNKQEKTCWHNCSAFAKTGETIAKYFRKGSGIMVTGEIDNSSYEQDGVTKYFSRITVQNFQFPPTSKTESSDSSSDIGDVSAEPPAPTFDSNEDIPF